MLFTNKSPHGRTSSRRIKAASALAVAATFMLAGCTSDNTAVMNASNVLQNVNVGLTSSAEISDISSTVVSFDAFSGKSSSEEQTYALRDAVNDLPVRITTRYTTDHGSGNDLNDLAGYTGDVSIDITVENLTVQPEDLTYDVAGTQKTKSTLVGAPLSVAASTTFEGVKPQSILSEATVGNGTTNGIISTNENGDATLQWAKILAGPSTSASSTFTVNLQAEDLKVPEFNIAVHPGLTNDLTSSGAVSSAFSANQDSTMELMQQTVEVVAEANQALADAGSTISDIRDNLNTTSESLKSSTVQELQQSSEQLTGQLSDLQEKLSGLRTNLDESAQGSQDELVAQMQQTVESLQNFFGQEGDDVPAPVFDAGTCEVNIAQPANGSTVYSNMVQLSNVLGAYSEANIDCRDQVVEVVNIVLGPENPTPETCRDSVSASCSVFNSQVVLTASLLQSAQQTNQLIEQLNPGALSEVLGNYQSASAALDTLQQQVDALQQPVAPAPTESASPTPSATPSTEPSPTPSVSPTATPQPSPLPTQELLASLDAIDQHTEASNDHIADLEELLGSINTTAQEALAELNVDTDETGSILTQNQELADQLCQLSDGGTAQAGKLPAEEVERLRGYLTDTPCADIAEPASDEKLPTPENYQQPLSQRLTHQVELWNSVFIASDVTGEESETTQKIAAITEDLTQVSEKTAAMRTLLEQAASPAPSPSASPSATPEPQEPTAAPEPTQEPTAEPSPETPVEPDTSVQAVKDAMPGLHASFDSLSTSLDDLSAQQQKLNDALAEIIEAAPAENAEEISSILATQARNVSQQRTDSELTITDLFSQQVTNLTGTSESISTGTEVLLKEQGDKLNAAAQRQVEEADARTKSSLERIQQSHDSATQDVAGASATLTGELQKLMLDMGDTSVNGSGLLGSLQNNAGSAGNADYQLSLATQNAEKYATIREEDMGAIRLKQEQYNASLRKLSALPAFHLSASSGATVKTIYTFTIGGEQ